MKVYVCKILFARCCKHESKIFNETTFSIPQHEPTHW